METTLHHRSLDSRGTEWVTSETLVIILLILVFAAIVFSILWKVRGGILG